MKIFRALLIAVFAAKILTATAESSLIPYDSPWVAEKALKAEPGMTMREENGWDVFSDKRRNIYWSVSTKSHPAYPTIVRRELVWRGEKLNIEFEAKCGASKPVCDTVVQQFMDSDEAIKRQVLNKGVGR